MKLKLTLLVLLALSLNLQAQTLRPQRRTQRASAVAFTDKLTTRHAADATTLPIRRVILYSNGVAYIERRGTVSGHAEINLSFKQSQVDDVLKSMVVLDFGRGRVGSVSYNSSAPPSARMADIPFSIGAETRGGASGGLAGVLGQLQGARVVVTTPARSAVGSILTVEERRVETATDKPPVITHKLVIVAENGELMSFDLADVRAVKLVDEGARRDISEFASATASARRRDAKTITVTSDGDGAREMLVSYTVAAPIWKTTYRVVLDPEGKPFFQGWAIVDNVSDEDWENVQLSLISGTPVSFIQPIQKPFYRYRPVVPMPGDLSLSPQIYEPETGEVGGNGSLHGSVTDPNGASVPGASVVVTNTANNSTYTTTTDDEGNFYTPRLSDGTYNVSVSAAGFSAYSVQGVNVSSARPTNLNIPLAVAGASEVVTVTDSAREAPNQLRLNSLNLAKVLPSARAGGNSFKIEPTVGEAMTGGESGVEAAAEGGEVGDLFEYKIEQPVTVRRDRSALIPILQTRMEGERVSVYNEAARRTRPMSGMFLKNTSALTLEDGALTVIDGDAYAGEALLERLKPTEQRLVSFALDLGTLVTTRQEKENSPVFLVRITAGDLQAHYYQEEKKTYTLTNQTDRPRVVFIEHPVRQDWQLDERQTPKPDGKSASFYRFRVALKARETKTLPVVEREEELETYALSDLTPELVAVFVGRRYIDEPTRAALQSIVEIKARLAAAAARVAAIEREIKEIGDDQKRLRDNIEALTKTAEARQLIARYVAKADQQETRIEQLTKEKQAANEEHRRLQSELNEAIRSLSFVRDL